MKNPCKLCGVRAVCNEKCNPFINYERETSVLIGWGGMALFILGGTFLAVSSMVRGSASLLPVSVYVILGIVGFSIMFFRDILCRLLLRRYPNANTM